eukprot:Amastigsp_a509793_202.p2 type:complete len:159 gc:universal Amastigsp_a509793_202:830-354(-)
MVVFEIMRPEPKVGKKLRFAASSSTKLVRSVPERPWPAPSGAVFEPVTWRWIAVSVVACTIVGTNAYSTFGKFSTWLPRAPRTLRLTMVAVTSVSRGRMTNVHDLSEKVRPISSVLMSSLSFTLGSAVAAVPVARSHVGSFESGDATPLDVESVTQPS